MSDLFITKIHIKQLRHLKNVAIDISSDERKHLILTGKNGSGKTSLIDTIQAYFSGEFCRVVDNKRFGEGLEIFFNSFFDKEKPLCMTLFFDAYRKLKVNLPKAIEPITIYDDHDGMQVADFVKYLLLLNYQRLDALSQGKHAKVNEIQNWFNMFKEMLKDIFNTKDLDLEHDSKDLSYKIIIPNREPFGLNELADGYSTFLDIVLNLMMKMESKASMTYDLPGIVFIDEIEAHLHVELQRLILPFLVKMFPRIQFIVIPISHYNLELNTINRYTICG